MKDKKDLFTCSNGKNCLNNGVLDDDLCPDNETCALLYVGVGLVTRMRRCILS